MSLNLLLWIAQVILAAMLLLAGVMKVFQYERAQASWPWVKDVTKPFVTSIGIIDLLGGLGVVLPWLTGILPWLTGLAAAGVALMMILASLFHIRRGESSVILFNLVLLALAVFVVYGRWFMG